MSGIDRLRTLAGAWDEWGLGGALMDVADEIERERACDADALENIRLIVGGVIDDMELHVSGVEGSEDSTVARWVRELREALGGDGCDHADEREAIAWVREHGGLEKIIQQRRESIPRAAYERKKAGFLGHIAECERALGRRNQRIAELEERARVRERANDELNEELNAMRPRLMPEGMEWLLEVWPKWSDGEYCKFGDWWKSDRYGEPEPNQFRKLSIYTPEQLREWGQDDGDNYGYEWDFVRPSDPKYRPDKVEPPAPKVIDADGAEIREGDTVWHVETGEQCKVVEVNSRSVSVDFRVGDDGTKHTGSVLPANLTHRAPVLAADGRPLEVGQTVYAKSYAYVKCTVLAIEWVVDGYLVEVENEGGHKFRQTPDEFTHERPDSWERVMADAESIDRDLRGFDGDVSTCADLVRRARALAERGK